MKVPFVSTSPSDGGERGPPPMFLKFRSSKWYIVTTVAMAIFTDIFLYGVIVPVVPFALETRVHIKSDKVQHWVSVLLAVYSAGVVIGSPALGWIADRVNTRRSPLLFGLLLLTGATLMLCLGKSIPVLVVGRLLQGLSASVVWVAGLALLVDTVGQKEIGQTMGYVSLAYTTGVVLAPLLGGAVYAGSGYYSVFYIAFALIAVDAVLRITFIEKRVAIQWLQDDASPMEEGMGSGTSDVADQIDETVAAKKRPAIYYLVTSRRMIAAFWGILAVAALLTAFDSVLPLYANKIFGFNSLGSGLLFLALLVPNILGPYIGILSDKYGPRWLVVTGFVLALPFLVLLRLVTHHTTGQIVLLCALLVMIGLGSLLAMLPLMVEFTNVTEAKQRHYPGIFGAKGAYAQAYGIFTMAWAAGSIVGPIWAGYIQARSGWGTMTWTLGLLSAFSAVPIAIYTGGYITRRHDPS